MTDHVAPQGALSAAMRTLDEAEAEFSHGATANMEYVRGKLAHAKGLLSIALNPTWPGEKP